MSAPAPPAPSTASRPVLRLGHSPDPDDAFMWWPLAEVDGKPPAMDTGRFRYEPVTEDIETLNRRSAEGALEITAMSCAQFPRVRDRYVLTACGSSMGDGYGPKLVARQPMSVDDLRNADVTIAIPGRLTSAFATASLLLGPGSFAWEERPFEAIFDDLSADRFEVGLIIHEGQLTYEQHGLHLVADLGQWWSQRTGLPLPLGVNAIRRDLDDLYGPGTIREVTGVLRRSIDFAIAHRREALAYALGFARGMAEDLADEFVDLYVNRWTLDFGARGIEAVQRFLAELHDANLTEDAGTIEPIPA